MMDTLPIISYDPPRPGVPIWPSRFLPGNFVSRAEFVVMQVSVVMLMFPLFSDKFYGGSLEGERLCLCASMWKKATVNCQIIYQSIPAVSIPLRADSPGNFLRGRNPHPLGKKRLQNPGLRGKNSRAKKL